MKQRNLFVFCAVVALIGIAVFFCLKRHPAGDKSQGISPQAQNGLVPPANVPPARRPTNGPVAAADTNVVYQIRADKVLASVNGVAIKLADLVPLTATNLDAVVPLDVVAYNYLLERAIVRELMMQTAKAQGIGISDAQQQQLAKLQAQREAPYPGQIAAMNVDTAAVELELRDAQAFMLQTALMAQKGFSPDVTPDQVQSYYQAHMSQYGDLPTDPQARKAAWTDIDIAIRTDLAAAARQNYVEQTHNVVNDLESKSQITRNKL